MIVPLLAGAAKTVVVSITRRNRQDRRGLDALGTSGVEGSADAG